MGKLDALKKLVAEAFEAAESKEDIDRLSKISTACDEAIEEEKKSNEEKAKLLKDYKEAIKYSVADSNTKSDEPSGQAPNLEAIIADALKK